MSRDQDFQVSVIIPTHNRAGSLEYAIQSVLSQSRPPLEIIVVDDGSTDATASAVSKYYDGTVRYHYQPNHGVSHARNTGIQLARGNWIALLDSDDRWLPDKLQQQVSALLKHPELEFCHSDEIWVRHGRRVNPKVCYKKYGGWIFEKCLTRCTISPSSVLMKKNIFSQLGGFDESLPACEDYDFWLRYCSQYPVLYVDMPLLLKFGGHRDQLSMRYLGMDQFRLKALLKLLVNNKLSNEQQTAVKSMFMSKYKILRQGAEKHNNRKLLQLCQSMVDVFETTTLETRRQFQGDY